MVSAVTVPVTVRVGFSDLNKLNAEPKVLKEPAENALTPFVGSVGLKVPAFFGLDTLELAPVQAKLKVSEDHVVAGLSNSSKAVITKSKGTPAFVETPPPAIS